MWRLRCSTTQATYNTRTNVFPLDQVQQPSPLRLLTGLLITWRIADQLVCLKRILLYSEKIRSATQATHYEVNSPAAEDHDAYKTLNGKNFPPPDVYTNPSLLRATALLRAMLQVNCPMYLTRYRDDDGVRKPSILHLPTSFPKQILTPFRFRFILLINNGIDWKIMIHLLSGLKTSVGV